MTECTLCGSPVGDDPATAADVDGVFCCEGCLATFQRLDETEDVSAEDLHEHGHDHHAHHEHGSDHEHSEGSETAFLSVDGMHCSTCESFIETSATETDGINDAQASYATDMVRLDYDPSTIDRGGLIDAVSKLGYHASDPDEEDEGAEERFEFGRLRLVFGGLAAMAVMMFYAAFLYPVYLGYYPESFLSGTSASLIAFVPIFFGSTIVLFGVGFPILRGAYVSLKVRQPNMDVLIAFAVLAAYVYSVFALAFLDTTHVYFDVSTMVIVVVSIGNHIEARFKRRALGDLSALTESRITEARVLTDEGHHDVALESLSPGDRVLVKPGERVPIDGTVVEGQAAIDESLVTGESVPVSKSLGEEVVGGSVVTDNAVEIEVGEEATSTFDRLVELIWNVQSSDSGATRLADRVASVFVPVVVTIATLATVGWLLTGASIGQAILIGVSVLVVSCPCSLGLATPLAIVSGVREAAERRITVLNATVLERITDTEIVAFDKTGTLTTGEMSLDGVRGDDPDELLARAAAVETRSSHPVAEAIVAADRDRGSDATARTVTDFESHARGVAATVDGERVVVGHPGFVRESGYAVPEPIDEQVRETRSDGFLATLVAWDDEAKGVLQVGDTPRADWAEVVSSIAEEGPRVVVLTGDDREIAERFSGHPDVSEVFAGVPPEAKEAVVGRLREEGTTTMVGDGTNDAPALAAADLGIAMANGTELAIDAADAVVSGDSLRPIPAFFAVARGTRRRLRTNLGWAFCYNLVAIPLAVAGLVNPLIAAAAMAVSSLVVVTNSARGMGIDPLPDDPTPDSRPSIAPAEGGSPRATDGGTREV
ncbi:cation-translocating P-type ATPase [Halococcus sp. IIIV-5B]|uniref:heavy metal translocating P-type ATPase n=1 Tax=Halococcus sp. IIIV-5B TaxID=2321230 RepID=UPI000E711623|nr:cation-translocating P-type ATPase [Halococcus sp. IIIV-5B]RJT02999.1 heavy metal translocating P-type ATPase [Halococcus sp. IIIV-5B]